MFFFSTLAAQGFTVDEDGSADNDSYNIEVTAQKRKEKVQDAAASITALQADDINDAGIDETQDIADYVPGMSTFNFSDTFSYYSMRGQTNFNSYSSPIGIYIDDVPAVSNANWTDVRLWNIEQIEVLRGAAGNLYGLNSTGGVINITTRKPDNYWTGGAKLGYGSYNSVNAGANISGPVIKDKLSFGVSGDYRRADSYIEEDGNDDRSGYFGGGRGQVRYTPFDRLELMVTVDGGHYDADYNTWTLADDDPYEIPSHNHDEYYKTTNTTESLKAVYSLDSFDITSVSALSQSDMEGNMELAFSSYGAGVSYYNDWMMECSAFAQELRFSSNSKKSPLTWLVGGFYKNNETEYDNVYVYSGVETQGADTELKQQTYSAFGEVAYTFFDALTVTPGIRYDYDSKEYKEANQAMDTTTGSVYNGAVDDSDNWSAVSPRLALDYKITNDLMVYTSVAQAHKAGGYASSGGVNSDAEISKFDPEDSTTGELGIKSAWLKNKVIANLAGYYTQIENMQVFTLDPATFMHIYSNAGQAVIYGVEAEFAVRPVRSVEVGVPLSYTFSEITEHEEESYEGNKVPLVPEYTAGLFAQYTHDLGIFVRGESNFLGKTYFDEANDKSQDAYMVVNAKLGYKQNHYTLSAYANNILSEEYYNYRVDGGMGTDFACVGAPRTLGLEASADF